jgi:hypothetical protein
MFDDIPEWRLEQIYADMVKKRQEDRAKKLGGAQSSWGGKRPGAGRPRTSMPKELNLPINNLQKKVLIEMGEGSLEAGIIKLINENM